MIKDGFDRTPKTAQEFEAVFQDSTDSKANFDSIALFESEKKTGVPKGPSSGYTLPFIEQVHACTIRQFQVLWGDKMSFFGKYILATFISLVFGSLFYKEPATTSGVFTRGGVVLYPPRVAKAD